MALKIYDFISFLLYKCYFCEALTEKYLLLLKSPIYFLRLSVSSVSQKYKVAKNLVMDTKGPEDYDPLSLIKTEALSCNKCRGRPTTSQCIVGPLDNRHRRHWMLIVQKDN